MANANLSAQLRKDAALAVFAVLEEGTSASQILPPLQKYYDSRDSALLQELFYGVLRELPLLQYWLRSLLNKPLKGRKKRIEHLIIVGFYQLAFTRVSEHAAVAETVGAMEAMGEKSLKGLVNAILRNFIRQSLKDNRPDDPIIASGFPKWLYRKVVQSYPEYAAEIFTQCRQRPPIWLRINQLKTDLSSFSDALNQKGIDHQVSKHHSAGLLLTDRVDITTLPGFAQGWFSVQDGAAQFAAELLDVQPQERVLDCCAAPGGKTCHILERQPEVAEVIALDSDEKRLHKVGENLRRLGLNAKVIASDACKPEMWWDGRLFDRILLDAPCSATGIIRKHQDIKWLRKSSDIDALVTLQRDIFDHIWRLLKPGGTLLYATCSILPEENSEQVKGFLARHDDANLQPVSLDIDSHSTTGLQILPGQQQMDGFYYARLLKS